MRRLGFRLGRFSLSLGCFSFTLCCLGLALRRFGFSLSGFCFALGGFRFRLGLLRLALGGLGGSLRGLRGDFRGLHVRGLSIQACDDGIDLVLRVEMNGIQPGGGPDGVSDDRIAFDTGLRECRIGAVGGAENIKAEPAVERLRQAVRPLQEDTGAGAHVERHGMCLCFARCDIVADGGHDRRVAVCRPLGIEDAGVVEGEQQDVVLGDGSCIKRKSDGVKVAEAEGRNGAGEDAILDGERNGSGHGLASYLL